MAELIKKTFIEILKDKNIIIPEIQREYVWGSKENIENCKKLLNDIIDSTENNYNIGFLYSYEKDNKVYLIDGQQRFTTLYLTLLYLSVKENKKDEYKENYLQNFSYKVRNLTKEFIDLMIEKIQKEDDFFDIANKTWCLSVYKKDPTIKNIINFFKIFNIDEKNNENQEYKNISLEDIKKSEFWYFNTSNTSQGEELYITMNSRGEKIAEYEDIRVSLLSKISEEPEEYKDKATKFNKIEYFFWKHRYKGKNNADDEFNKFLRQIIALSRFDKEDKEIGDLDKEKEKYFSDYKNFLELDDIIYHYHSLELLYELLENKEDLSKLENDKNILDVSTIIIPFLYIVKNIFKIDSFDNINKDTKEDLFQWLRFLYNIRFNHDSKTIYKILNKIKEYENNKSNNIFEYFKNENIETLLNYYKNYNGERNNFNLLESEVNKIKLLSIYNDKERNELQRLFWELEDNKILKGNIDYIIKYSLENKNINDVESIKKDFFNIFNKYKYIFETCFNKVERDILIRALLTFAKKNTEKTNYFESHIKYTGWSWYFDGVYRFSLCVNNDEWNESFQNTNSLYDTNIYYKKLFDKIYASNDIKEKLNDIIEEFKRFDEIEQKENPFYKIINDIYKVNEIPTIDYKYIAYNRDIQNKCIIALIKNKTFRTYDYIEYKDIKKIKRKRV